MEWQLVVWLLYVAYLMPQPKPIVTHTHIECQSSNYLFISLSKPITWLRFSRNFSFWPISIHPLLGNNSILRTIDFHSESLISSLLCINLRLLRPRDLHMHLIQWNSMSIVQLSVSSFRFWPLHVLSLILMRLLTHTIVRLYCNFCTLMIHHSSRLNNVQDSRLGQWLQNIHISFTNFFHFWFPSLNHHSPLIPRLSCNAFLSHYFRLCQMQIQQ